MNYILLIAALFFYCSHAADKSHQTVPVEVIAQSLAEGKVDEVASLLKPLSQRDFRDALMDGFMFNAATNPDTTVQVATAVESLVPQLITDRFVTFYNKHKVKRSRPAYVTELLAHKEKFNHVFGFFIERRLEASQVHAAADHMCQPFFSSAEETFLKNAAALVSFKLLPSDLWRVIEQRFAHAAHATQQAKVEAFLHILKCFPENALELATSHEDLFNEAIKDPRIWDIDCAPEVYDRIKAGLISMPSLPDVFTCLYDGNAYSVYDRLRYFSTKNDRRGDLLFKKTLMKELFCDCFDQQTSAGTFPLMHYVSSFVRNFQDAGQISPFSTDVALMVKEFLSTVSLPDRQVVLCHQVAGLIDYLRPHVKRLAVAQEVTQVCFDYIYRLMNHAGDDRIKQLYAVLTHDVAQEIAAFVVKQFKEDDLSLAQVCCWSAVLPQDLLMTYMPQERDIARIICMANAVASRPGFLDNDVCLHQLEHAFLSVFQDISSYNWRMYTADVCGAVVPLRSFALGMAGVSADRPGTLSKATEVLIWLLTLETEVAHYKDLLAASVQDVGAQADTYERIREELMADELFEAFMLQAKSLRPDIALERIDSGICMLNEALGILLRDGVTDEIQDDAIHGIALLAHLYADSCTFLPLDGGLAGLRSNRFVHMISALMRRPIAQPVERASYCNAIQWAMLSNLTPDFQFYAVIFDIFDTLASQPAHAGSVVGAHRLLQIGLSVDHLLVQLSPGRLHLRAHIQQLLSTVEPVAYQLYGVELLRDMLRDETLPVALVRHVLPHIDPLVIQHAQGDTTRGLFLAQLFTDREIGFMPDLLACGFDINARGSHQQTALMQAALRGNVSLVRSLLDHHAQVCMQDDAGRTALGYTLITGSASVADKHRMLDWLVGVDRRLLDLSIGAEQLSPLMLFIKERVEGLHNVPDDEMVALTSRLLELGLRPEVQNAYQETAADMAYRGSLQPVGELLCQRMYVGSDFLDYGQALELVDQRVGAEVPLHVITHVRDQMQLLFTYEHTKIRRELIEREIAQAVGQGGQSSSAAGSLNRIVDADGRRQFMTFGSYRKLVVSGSLHQFLRAHTSIDDMREVVHFGAYLRQSLATAGMPEGRLLTFDDYPAVDPVTQEGLQISLEQFHELLEHTVEDQLKLDIIAVYASQESLVAALESIHFAADAVEEQRALYARSIIDLGCMRDVLESFVQQRHAKHRKL